MCYRRQGKKESYNQARKNEKLSRKGERKKQRERKEYFTRKVGQLERDERKMERRDSEEENMLVK